MKGMIFASFSTGLSVAHCDWRRKFFRKQAAFSIRQSRFVALTKQNVQSPSKNINVELWSRKECPIGGNTLFFADIRINFHHSFYT